MATGISLPWTYPGIECAVEDKIVAVGAKRQEYSKAKEAGQLLLTALNKEYRTQNDEVPFEIWN